jgi:uncharacterized protein (DUF2147 family)
MKYVQLLAFLMFSTPFFAQSALGIWKNIDDTDGVEKSHIEIYEEDGKIYGKVIKLLPAATIITCKKCKGDKKNAPILDMTILRDLKKDGDKWSGGMILDPAKGKEYRCFIALENENKLKVRGFIGSPMFGRTQYWYRVE